MEGTMTNTKITLEQILIGEQAIAKLGEAIDLPAKTKYWLGKLIDVCGREVRHYQELRVGALTKYGTAPALPGDAYVFEDGKREAFEKEIRELLQSEVEVKLKKLTFEDLDSCDLSAIEMNSISWMIEEEKADS